MFYDNSPVAYICISEVLQKLSYDCCGGDAGFELQIQV